MKNSRRLGKRIVTSSYTLSIVGLVSVILVSAPLYKNIRTQMEINNEITTLDKEIEDLEKKNTELKDLIVYLSSDDFAEEQARLNLNFKKEGEEVLVIKGETSATEQDELGSIYNIKGLNVENEEKKEGNAKKWLDYYWGHD